MPKQDERLASSLHTILATVSFTVCFAGWGLIAALAPKLQTVFNLTATETAWLVALPVLLGSAARIPAGILCDKFGGRLVFTALMLICSVLLCLPTLANNTTQLFASSLCLGLVGSAFVSGATYVANRAPPRKVGSTLGIFGLSDLGLALCLAMAPGLSNSIGWQNVFYAAGAALSICAIIFAVGAGKPVVRQNEPTLRQLLGSLVNERMVWLLGLFYFLTFGGFVAFAIYLPTLLQDQFHLTHTDAGFRTAVFVIIAALSRPLGGWLADQIGGARALSIVFFGVTFFG